MARCKSNGQVEEVLKQTLREGKDRALKIVICPEQTH